jgi:hypothetical protein
MLPDTFGQYDSFSLDLHIAKAGYIIGLIVIVNKLNMIKCIFFIIKVDKTYRREYYNYKLDNYLIEYISNLRKSQ